MARPHGVRQQDWEAQRQSRAAGEQMEAVRVSQPARMVEVGPFCTCPQFPHVHGPHGDSAPWPLRLLNRENWDRSVAEMEAYRYPSRAKRKFQES